MQVILVFMIYNVTTGRVFLDTILYVLKFFANRPHPQIHCGAHTSHVKPVSESVHRGRKSQVKVEGSPQSAVQIRNTWRFLCILRDVLMTRCYLSLILFLKVYFGQNYLIQFSDKDFKIRYITQSG